MHTAMLYNTLQAFVPRINMEGGFEVGKESVSYQIPKKRKREMSQKGIKEQETKETLKAFTNVKPVNLKTQCAGMTQVREHYLQLYILIQNGRSYSAILLCDCSPSLTETSLKVAVLCRTPHLPMVGAWIPRG